MVVSYITSHIFDTKYNIINNNNNYNNIIITITSVKKQHYLRYYINRYNTIKLQINNHGLDCLAIQCRYTIALYK